MTLFLVWLGFLTAMLCRWAYRKHMGLYDRGLAVDSDEAFCAHVGMALFPPLGVAWWLGSIIASEQRARNPKERTGVDL